MTDSHMEPTQMKLLRRSSRRASIFDVALTAVAARQAVLMLKPWKMIRNPVMFVTELGAILSTFIGVHDSIRGVENAGYSLSVAVILWVTVLFANFAEALAEARGRAQADTLKQTRSRTVARRVVDNIEMIISSDELKAGNVVLVREGELIPADGEVIQGVASVDESAITGESAPVLREAGGDRSGVTGGTRVLSDSIRVRVTTGAGESFLDRMISLVEGAVRQKSPNELALTVTLAGLTLAFLMVAGSLWPISRFFGVTLPLPTLIALLVCLIPTTIGALLSAIGLAGMDRALSANVLAKSGRAVELAGDIDTLLLDKTGTITMGNRQATSFHPLAGVTIDQLALVSLCASIGDTTPEGKSILSLGEETLGFLPEVATLDASVIEFSAQTRLSGVDFKDGRRFRKGASNAMADWIRKNGGVVPEDLQAVVDRVASAGATPVVVAEENQLRGVVCLSDVLKPNIRDRIERLRAMGLRVVMVTGDNPLTAAAIARQAGVDQCIAEARPEDKLEFIRKEQRAGRLIAMMGDGTNDAPALAQADIGIAMNSGTQAAKEAGNMVDLDSDPTKLIEVIEIGKQLLMTRGALTTFSIANDIAKYFAIIPAMFMMAFPELNALNIMHLSTPQSAVLSALIFNAIVIPMLIPVAIKGVKYRPMGADAILRHNLAVYGFGGIAMPFLCIKLIDMTIRSTRLF